MHRFSSIVRITVALTFLSITVLLCAQTIGLIPDQRVAIAQGRISLSESLAIQCSRMATDNRIGTMKAGLKANLKRKRRPPYIREGESVKFDGSDSSLKIYNKSQQLH